MIRSMTQRALAVTLVLLTVALGACSPIVPVTPTAGPAAEAPQAAGIYRAFMPGASSPGLDMTLYLDADGSLRLVNDYQNEEPPFVETGAWSAAGDVVTITLEGAESRTLNLLDGQLVTEEWIGPWHNFAGLAAGTIPPYEASALEDAVAEGEFAGYYKAFSPSASCCGLDQTLLLAADNSARLTGDYLNGEPPIVEIGSWEVDEDGRVTVSLARRTDGVDYATAVVFVLAVENGRLVTVEASADRFSPGLTFYYFPGLARPNMN